MNNTTGFVINIKKYFPGDSEVSFMQFMLKYQLHYSKSALYYVFKKDDTIIGYTEIENFLSVKSPKGLFLFVNPSFENMGISSQMINFAMTDNEKMKFTSTVDSKEFEQVSALESLGYTIKHTQKTFVVKNDNCKDRLPRCSVQTIAKSNKNLATEFEKEFVKLIQTDYAKSGLKIEDIADSVFLENIRSCYDYHNGYLYIVNGKVCGWALFEKPTSSTITLSQLRCIDEKEGFADFLKDLVFTIFKDFIEIKFTVDENDDEKHMLVSLFDTKPNSIRYTYSNE